MGCACSIHLYCHTESTANQVFDLCYREADRLDKYYTNFSSTSFTAQINSTSGNPNGIEIDAETKGLLDYATACYEQTNGLFDLTAGILYGAWKIHQNNQKKIAHPPKQALIDTLLQRVGWDKVEFNNHRLILPIPGMMIDFGGIVKEYAADRLAQICYSNNIHHGIINLSGDMRILGPHPDSEPWEVPIKAPRTKTTTNASVKISQGAVATSGDYAQCIFIHQKRYCHIINPKTGWPVHGISSITAVTDLCIVAGTLTTSAILMGKKNGIKWLSNLNTPFIAYDDKGREIGKQLHIDIENPQVIG